MSFLNIYKKNYPGISTNQFKRFSTIAVAVLIDKTWIVALNSGAGTTTRNYDIFDIFSSWINNSFVSKVGGLSPFGQYVGPNKAMYADKEQRYKGLHAEWYLATNSVISNTQILGLAASNRICSICYSTWLPAVIPESALATPYYDGTINAFTGRGQAFDPWNRVYLP